MQQDQLIRRFQQQDCKAVGEVYDAYAAALYGAALRIVQEPDLAQQVLQDTFLKAWRNATAYDPEKGRFYTWLLNILRNTAIDSMRSAHYKHFGKTTDSLERIDAIPGGSAPNTDHIGLRELVGRMQPKYKLVLEMVYFEGYTCEETATLTGIPAGTVKTRLRYAIHDLRRLFEEPRAKGVPA